MERGTVYTETIVYSAPEALVNEVPYQIAIVELEGGGRITVRMRGEAVRIGDAVEFIEKADGVSFWRRS
jgi:uncharacterized OB-fold protein